MVGTFRQKTRFLYGLFSLGIRADCLSAKLTFDSVAYITFFGYRRALRRDLQIHRLFLNVVSEVFVHRSLLELSL